MTRAVLLPALALGLAAAPVTAQDAPSLWDLLKPELIFQRALQSGIMMARTQVDIQYGDMIVSPVTGQVAISDLTIWPLPDWDENNACVISIDRAVIRGAAVDEAGRLRMKMQLTNATADPACLPPDAQEGFALSGLDTIDIPRATFDVDYDVPSAGADVQIYALVSDFAAVTVNADFSYLWFDGRDDMDNPDPVIFLRHASATVENLGGYEAMQGMIPPPFSDPQSAPGFLSSMLGQALAQANRDAAENDDTASDGAGTDSSGGFSSGDGANDPSGDPSALSDAQQALVASAEAAIAAFLNDPSHIVIETGFDPEDPAFVDVIYYEDNPMAAIEDLQPRFGRATARTRQMLPIALLSQAIGETADTLPEADRLAAGIALVTGEGAPRNINAGMALLGGLAEAGNSDAAIELARALVGRDSEEAYRWALRAGEAGAFGATSLLDRIEPTLSFARVLDIQSEVLGNANYPIEALAQIQTIRREAAMRMSGIGRGRSYQAAALWAILARAAGDPEAAGILDDIDDIVRMAGGGAREAWDVQEKISADLALQVWIGQDLPARYAAE